MPLKAHLTLLLALVLSETSAAYKDDVKYSALVQELALRSILVPDGNGVSVTQVEAREDTDRDRNLESNEGYRPNPANSEFNSKTITDVTNLGQDPSDHGTWVGQNLYGNSTSIAPRISTIDIHEANNFLNSGWYSGTPPTEPNPLQNHSWINWYENNNSTRRMDYATNRDVFLPIVGLYNSDFGSQSTPSDIPDTYGSIYNGISVGVSDGTHRYGTTSYDGLGRVKPEIVAPGRIPGSSSSSPQYTSFATPVVTSAAAMLIDAADTDNNAKHPITLKAILLAGADKSISTSWDQTPTRPIDEQYGAGQLDIYESYFIQQGGEQASANPINEYGWDLAQLSKNDSNTYTINVATGYILRNLSVVTTWNRDVSKLGFIYSPSLADISLELSDDSNNSTIQSSDSSVDNIEHIWRDASHALTTGSYTLTVETDDAVQYAIAWRSELYQDYSLWQSVAFNSTPISEQNPTDDPDHDNIENLLELAFGGDPQKSDQSILPTHDTVEDGGEHYLQISYRKPTHANGLTYAVETVSELDGTWSSSESEVNLISISPESGEFDRYTYRLVGPVSSQSQAFLRVVITE